MTKGWQSIVLIVCFLFIILDNNSSTFVSAVLQYGLPTSRLQYGTSTSARVITSANDVAINDCILSCGARDECDSMTYRRLDRKCSLHYEITNEEDTFPETGVIYSQKLDWAKAEVTNCSENCTTSAVCSADDTSGCYFKGHCKGFPNTDLNVELLGNVHFTNAIVKLRCVEGFEQIRGENVAVCQSMGSWRGGDLKCWPQFYVNTYGARLSNPRETIEYVNSTISRAECISECANEAEFCVAVSYSIEENVCELSTEHVHGNGENIERARGFEIIHMVLPVFYVSREVPYDLAEAIFNRTCLALNTTIASSYNLQEAYNLGYNMNACGWVAEKQGRRSMHFRDGIYNNMDTSIGVIECPIRDVVGVYCKNTLYIGHNTVTLM